MARNPFEDDEYENEEDLGSDSSSMKQLRDYAKKLERENKALTREADSLREFKAEAEATARKQKVTSVFKEVGLSEKHGALFARLNPEGEITSELVRQFAQEYDLPVSEGTGEPEPMQENAPASDLPAEGIQEVAPPNATPKPGFAPVQGTGQPSQRFVTDIDEAQKMMVDNPQEFARLYQAGRIKLEKLPGSGDRPLPGASA